MDDALRQFAQQVILAEAAAVRQTLSGIGESFERAARMILDCPGAVLTTGVGKAGIIARKLCATLSSTGTPSHWLNPADALHGDVGAIQRGDLVLMLSYSGESEELLRLLSLVRKLDHPVISITRNETNSLAKHSQIVLCLGEIEEACPLGLAPAPPPRRCWPWAMRWRCPSCGCAISPPRISPCFIRPASSDENSCA